MNLLQINKNLLQINKNLLHIYTNLWHKNTNLLHIHTNLLRKHKKKLFPAFHKSCKMPFIMLKFNVKKIFALRGIEKTTAFLVNLGMGYPAASRFLRAKSPYVKIRDIEKVCIALNCTPNDLFEWTADAKTVLPATHSLNALQKGENTRNLQEMIKDIPSDKLRLIETLLNELKN
jgi:DNA-binding Xre family transcriptional regulator